MSEQKTLISVVGPTAVGKTAFAIALAQHYQTEIISADSRQFYEELAVGVARPTPDELVAAPHHFIAFLKLEETYSAGRFEKEALELLDQKFESHPVMICAGGSGLYLQSLLEGLDDLPADAKIKSEIQATYDRMGLEPLQEELKARDPDYFDSMDTQNPHRLIRALEVCRVSGTTYSSLRKNTQQARDFSVVKIGLESDRAWLYDRINRRVDIMMQAGLEQEARNVFEKRHLNALNTVGYKELFDYFDGKCSKEEAVEKIKQHTRNYAKRQLTWWRKDAAIHWVNAMDSESAFLDTISWVNGK